jgi:hypothetical protein
MSYFKTGIHYNDKDALHQDKDSEMSAKKQRKDYFK